MEKNIVKKKQISHEDAKKEIIRKRDQERQKVKGRFDFKECRGGTLSFVYKAYPGDDVERYDLVDGCIYELPLGVARHLNNNVWYPNHAYMLDDKGKAMMHLKNKVHRTAFQNLEFIDLDEIDKDIVLANPV